MRIPKAALLLKICSVVLFSPPGPVEIIEHHIRDISEFLIEHH